MVTILYKTDFMHSLYSRDIIGVFSNKSELIKQVKKIIKSDLKENYEGEEPLQEYIMWNINFFMEQKQTQGLCSFELHSEQVELNKIF